MKNKKWLSSSLLMLVMPSLPVLAAEATFSALSSTPGPDFLRQADDQPGRHICGVDDNGQDWPELLDTLTQELKANRQARKLADGLKSPLTAKQALNQAAENDIIARGEGLKDRYYIPVVVHVYGQRYNCDDAAGYCLTDEKIIEALNLTNADFQGLNTQDGPIHEHFQSIRDNLNIEFVLAAKTPDGEPSNGIVRYDHEQTGYGGTRVNSQVANDAWDNYKYLNIYIMQDLYGSGTLNNSGVAWYPDVAMSDAGIARVVYNGDYLGVNTNENFRSVLTHEFGHWLNLIHTFSGNSCSIDGEAFCRLSGDRSCDTPQMENSYLRDNEANCIGQATNTENFMHYSDNYAMFTAGQISRMKAALHGDARRSIWSNSNLIATGLAQYTSSEQPVWDGTGADQAFDPQGKTVIFQQTDLSAEQDGISRFELTVPEGTQALAFYLDGYSQDPDLYLSKGSEPTADENGNWDADYISFNASGTPEIALTTTPVNAPDYHGAIHAYSSYSSAQLRVFSLDDATLCDGCSRVFLHNEKELAAQAGDPVKNYRFNIPEDAEQVVIVINDVLRGNPDLYVSQNIPFASTTAVSDNAINRQDAHCRPQAAKYGVEYCEFDSGGSFYVQIDTASSYSQNTLQVYYQTSGSTDLLPYAKIEYQGANLVDNAISFNGENSYDTDGDILEYFWQFGDGEVSELASPQHSYSETGTYTVSLMVTDNRGNSATESLTLNIHLSGDWDLDGDIDMADIRSLMTAIQQGQDIPAQFDANRDGQFDVTDVRALQARCSYDRCALQAPAP
ncbi:M43 family zinc metalloprotease [Thalassomonas actiniarum]|uniref:PKD domain-containing protein n=1 Tax=Thalassomonas actiniarum TaxID=485447 RepID=A0AAE9YTR7_9GAMM|nr:M43 family zinc metalloprotease [Thalassomonas actiniarum]WDE01046.1 PKD domain-containing protein [Thalassomonas actiniarum]